MEKQFQEEQRKREDFKILSKNLLILSKMDLNSPGFTKTKSVRITLVYKDKKKIKFDTFELDTDLMASLLTIKILIKKKKGYEIKDQRLIFKEEELKDDKMHLYEYGLNDDNFALILKVD